MRTPLTLRRPSGDDVDVVLTTDVEATVGDVADALARAEAASGRVTPPPGEATLEVLGPDGGRPRVLTRTGGLAEEGLRAGSAVTLVTPSDAPVDPVDDEPEPAAVVRVLAGPDAGAAFPVRAGVSTVGRALHCDVVLSDPLVSKTHARLTVTERVEVVDAGSVNGVLVGTEQVDRAVMTTGATVVLGDTVLTVERREVADAVDGAAEPATPTGAVVAFNRSPRVVPLLGPEEVPAPAPPAPARPGRFPVLALAAPLLLGATLYGVTRSTLSLVFVALSPLLMIGTWLDRRWQDARRLREQTAQFRSELTALEADLARRHDAERAVRLAEAPSCAELVVATSRRTPVLWTRRPEHPTFLVLRLGVGLAPSRTRVALPPRADATAEHWALLEGVRDRWAEVDAVPVTVDLRACGALGLAGPDPALDGVAHAVLVQVAALHSPAEVVLAALTSTQSAGRWAWLRWLPHVTSPHSPLSGHHLASTPAAGAALLTRLEELVAARRGQTGRRAPHLPAVVVVVQDDAPVDRGRLVRLAEDGAAAAVHVVWCATTVEHLPAVCRAFVTVDDGARGVVGNSGAGRVTGAVGLGVVGPDAGRVPGAVGVGGVGPGGEVVAPARVGVVDEGRWTDVTCERVDAATATSVARRLAAVVDAGAPVLDESDVPRTASWLALAGPELASDPGAVVDRWRQTGSILDRSGRPPVRRRHDATLRALVGQGSDRELVLDLRAQGPHALVGGTTGSGKSEFLQSWVLGMAAAHSPDRVTFLLVDYKGGAAFADCVDLPHCVGLVTDLTPHLVRRALTSLRAELRHRERLLHRRRAKDLLALERSGDPETPPALVIVVDEFAALVSEVPEFVDGVVDVAQRGRSLGLHLVLATQRPAGVIKDSLRANTALRIALRMADEHDSQDVLGTPVAATFDPAVPGRGAVRTGPGGVAMFQTGYVGGRTSATPPAAAVGVETLAFGPGEPWDVPAAPGGTDAEADDAGPTDIARVVRTIAGAAVVAGVPAPRRPWLPELGTVYRLADVASDRGGHDTDLVLGVVDLPATQSQAVLSYRPDADGAMVVHGTGGSGKSTVLRTLAVTAGLAAEPVHVYGIDAGSGGLTMLEALPHVGSVVEVSDVERVQRLLRLLRETVEERAGRYAAARASTVTEYRRLAGRPDEPRVLLLVDGLSAFRDAWESEPGRAQAWGAFARVVAEGRAVGVHVVMTAERPGAVPTSLAGSVARRLVLRQAEETAYGVLGVPKDVLGPQSPPGRGVLAGRQDEVQVAVVGGPTAAEQAAAVADLAERLRADGATPAPPVRRLPTYVELAPLPTAVDGRPVIGLADDTLGPVGLDPHGTFLVAGLPGSGRTTALTAIACALRRATPDVRMVYVGSQRSPAHAAGVWSQTAVTAEEATALARDLLPGLREAPAGDVGTVLVVEGITDLLGGPAELPLTEAVKVAKRNGHLVVAEADTTAWGSSWPLVAEVRGGRRGLVLQPDHLDGDALFRTAFPRMSRAEFPPGRGVLVEQGRLRRVQVAVPG